MKIRQLHIENFRNHKETVLSLDRINFFAGHNNAGKSSILAALEWALTGRCFWTDKAGRGAADLIRQGEKKASVALELEGLGTVLRSLPPHMLQVGRISGINEGQAALQNLLRADESRLQVALNANAFLSLSPAEQRSFLFSAYGLSWTVDQVIKELERWLIRQRFMEAEAQRLAVKVKKYYPSGITSGPEIFEAMEKRAKEDRKDYKKDKQQALAALAEINAVDLRQEVPENLADSKDHLTELKATRDNLLQACGASRAAEARRQFLHEKIRETEEKLTETFTKVQSLSHQLKDLDSKHLNGASDSLGADTAAVAESSEVETALLQELNVVNKAAAAARNKLESLNKAGQALTGEERRCPLAPDLLPCTLTSEQLEAILSSLRREYKTTCQELENFEAEALVLTEKLASVRTSLNESRNRSKQALFLQSEFNTQRNKAENLEVSLSEMRKELESLPDEDSSMLQDLAQLEATINQIEKTLAHYQEAQALSAHRVELERDVKTLTAQVEDLEILVKALGPDGLRKDLLAGILEGFIGRVNDRLGRLTEGTYHLSLAPDMTLHCLAGGGPTLPLKLLSKSEQLRVGIALSEALSATVGLKFLAIDEADMLDQENRDLLTEMLLNTAEEYDQILVFTTVGDVQPENPGLPGIKMFWVEDGAVQEL